MKPIFIKYPIIILMVLLFSISCHNHSGIHKPQNANEERLNNFKKILPDSLKHLLSKLDSAYKRNPNQKLPSELDVLREFVPDSLKYLIPILDTVYEDDQRYREVNDMMLTKQHSKEVHYLDSVNLTKVVPIIQKYGILSAKDIGLKGHLAIFMVLQHAPQKIQITFLPVVEDAYKNKKINAGDYSMFVDRVLLHQGKMQLYGTQIRLYKNDNAEIEPVFDVDNLQKRRDSIGLGPYQKYLDNWNIKWNVEAYKKDLPGLMKKYNIN